MLTRKLVHCTDFEIDAYELEGYMDPFPSHVHDFYVVGLAVRGNRRLCVRGEECNLGAGDLLLLNPGDSHACSQLSEEPFTYRAFNIPPKTMKSICGHSDDQFPNSHFKSAQVAMSFSRCLVHDGVGRHLFMKASEAFLQRHNWQEGYEYLSRFFEQLSHGSSVFAVDAFPEEQYREETADQATITALCAYMEAHYQETLTLDELCEVEHVSQSSLLRLFTRVLGITPYKYLESVRVEHARKQLIRGDAPSEVAFRCGFTNQSHFTRVFAAFTGITPAAFQRMYNAK